MESIQECVDVEIRTSIPPLVLDSVMRDIQSACPRLAYTNDKKKNMEMKEDVAIICKTFLRSIADLVKDGHTLTFMHMFTFKRVEREGRTYTIRSKGQTVAKKTRYSMTMTLKPTLKALFESIPIDD